MTKKHSDDSSLGERPSPGQSTLFGVSRELAIYRAPADFQWECSALYCLPVRHVHFQAIFPSDSGKLEFWHPLLLSQNSETAKNTFRNPKYTWQKVQDQHIDLNSPYLPYTHFRQSGDYRSGSLYRCYVKAAKESSNVQRIYWL